MRTSLVRSLIALSLSSLLAGCGTGGRGAGSPVTDGGMGNPITLTPADPVLAVDGKNPSSLAFQVARDGTDVTSLATLTVDNAAIGAFSGGTFTSLPGAAGNTTVHATLDGQSASTSLTLTLTVATVVIAPGTPADAPSKFGGSNDPTLAPTIAYPPGGALIPPNLNELEVQWQPAHADLFEVSFVGDAIDLKIYTTCVSAGSGCALLPDENTWKLLSMAARGQTLKVTIRGASAQGGGVGTSGTQSLSFGDDDIQGGLYYWAAASGGVYRYDFGLRGQKAESFYDPVKAGGAQCVGCHALSRNGKRIAVGLNIPAPSQMRTLDVATRKTLFEVGGGMMGFPGMGGSDYETFTSDGGKIITTEGGGLTVRDAATGNPIGPSPAVANADMPDISPDAAQVVFARSADSCMFGICMTLSVMNANLYTVSFNGKTFGTPKIIVNSNGKDNYYPSYSPDGQFIVFNRSPDTSYDSPGARVMVVPAGGGTAIDLQTVNAIEGNSWPKWGPFVQHFKGSTIMWITFSSRRAYGLRQPMEAGKPAAQLWMVPVDTAKLQQSTDPGYPAIWMPFQDISTGNHIAQWVEKVERAPCSQVDQSGCGSGEMCVNGQCVPGIQ